MKNGDDFDTFPQTVDGNVGRTVYGQFACGRISPDTTQFWVVGEGGNSLDDTPYNLVCRMGLSIAI